MKKSVGWLLTILVVACGNATFHLDGNLEASAEVENTRDRNADTPNDTPSPANTGCEKDDDCVPATCCHPDACVVAAEAPDCSDSFCTTECRPGTLDCAQGTCRCRDGQCIADIQSDSL